MPADPSSTAAEVLADLGWDEGWAAAMAELGDPSLRPGRIARVDRGMCTAMMATGELRVVTRRGVGVAVGDWAAVADGAGPDERPHISAVLPRRTAFRRAAVSRGGPPQVLAANIDTVFVCDALDGRLGLRHLERFLALAWQSGATPVVLVTKSDSVAPSVAEEAVRSVAAVAAGVDVLVVSSSTGAGMERLAPYLPAGRAVALLGLSGAGKSTLANLLAGADVLSTGAVRKDGSGRHTTTHRELIRLPGGGLLIDTPGMRALSVEGAGAGIEQAFVDVEDLVASCRYRNCSHANEEGCAVRPALDDGRLARRRFESWLRLRAEPASLDLAETAGHIEERKRRKAAKVAERRAGRR